MPLKTSIFLDDHLAAELAARDDDNRSGAVSRIIERYAEIMRRERPDLSVPEWKLVVDTLNGCILAPARMMMSALSIEVADAIRLNRLDEKWDVDGKALLAKIDAMSFAQRAAVVDVAERFWIEVGRGNDSKVPGEQ